MKAPRLLLRVSFAIVVVAMAGCSAEAKKERWFRRAEDYLKAGKTNEARIEYFNVLQLDPANARAHEKLAAMFFEQGAWLRAVPHLTKQLAVSPHDRAARLKLAEVNLALGKPTAAHREIGTLLDRHPNDGEALILLIETVRTAEEFAKARERLPKNPQGDARAVVAQGLAELRAGDVAGARRLFQRAVALDPKSDAAHLALAKLHFALNERESAGKEFKLAAELAPLRSVTRLSYPQYLARVGQMEEALAAFGELAKQAPDYLPALNGEAEVALNLNRLDRAQELVQGVLKRDVANYEAVVLDARIALARGNVDAAITRLEKLGATVPTLAADKYHLARAYLLKKDREKAIATMQVAVRMNPDHEQAVVELAQLKLLAGQAEQVVGDMVEILTIRPNFVRAQVLLTDALRALGRHDDAIKVVQEQIRANPRAVQPLVVLGVLLREQNKPLEARASFEKALALAPLTMPAIAQLVELDVRDGRFEAATARVTALLAKVPDAADAHFLQASILTAQQKWQDAEPWLLKTIELNEAHGSAYELLLACYSRGQRLPAGTQQIDGLLEKRPSSLPTLLLGATIALQRQDYAKARDLYERGLTVRPDTPLALNNLACIYADHLEQLDRAHELAKRLRELEPNNAAAADTLGWILYKRKEYPQALALIEEGALKAPKSAEMQYHLGKAHEALGNREQARAAYEQAANGIGEFPGKAEIKDRLASLAAAGDPPKP